MCNQGQRDRLVGNGSVDNILSRVTPLVKCHTDEGLDLQLADMEGGDCIITCRPHIRPIWIQPNKDSKSEVKKEVIGDKNRQNRTYRKVKRKGCDNQIPPKTWSQFGAFPPVLAFVGITLVSVSVYHYLDDLCAILN